MKKIYFLFGTALLLCCLVNFNVARAQDGASATWTLNKDGSTVVNVGTISATEATLGQFTTYDQSNNGAETSMRIHVTPELVPTETSNGWPATQQDTIKGVYVQFAVTPAAGQDFTVNTIAYRFAARSLNNLKAKVFYSTDPTFKTATPIPNATGMADDFVPRDEITNDDETTSNVLHDVELTNLAATASAGETFYFRIYPWVNNDATVRTGKYLLLGTVSIAGATTPGIPACEESVIDPYIAIDGEWGDSRDAVTVNTGQQVQFGPQPNTGGSWSWTGPDGFSSTARDPEFTNITTEQAGQYVATHVGASCVSTHTFTITVNATDPGTDPGTDPDPEPSTGKRVAYITLNKTTMAEGATAVTEDPIIQMLEADENIDLDVITIEEDAGLPENVDLNSYDAVVVQESITGSDAILTPEGDLALASIPVPFLYNKAYAFNSGRAVGETAGSAKEAAGLSVSVLNPDHALFEGIELDENNEFVAFNALSSDLGETGVDGSVKALNYAIEMTFDPANSTLAQPATLQEGESLTPANTLFINDIPAGTTINGQELASRMIHIGMNFGAISATEGDNITDAALTLWKNAVYELAGVSEDTDPGTDPDPEAPTIVFVTDDDLDNDQIDWLETQGYTVNTFYSATAIENQEDIDMLNAADLVIIGRSGTSSEIATSTEVWNALTTPIILNAQYAVNTDRLGWFQGSAAHLNDDDGAIGVVNATIEAPNDPVFADINLGEDNMLPWSNTPEDYFTASDPGNATIMATANNTELEGAILFARFAANQPFFTGGEAPNGERVYFGFGNDATTDENEEKISNFFPLTEQAKQVYLNEIMRLAGEPGDGGTTPDPTVSAPSNPTPADDEEDVETANLTLEWEGDGETYNVYWGTSEDNLALAENGEGLTTTTFSPANVLSGTEYFWRVYAMAEGAETAMGPIWSFTTAGSPPSDATLTDLTINGTTISGFDAATQTYTMPLPAGTTTVTVDATPAAGATISEDGTGPITLTEGDNEHVIVVTAADGTEMEYTVNFVVAPTGITNLASQGINIYPNPINGHSTLTLGNAKDLATVNVYSAQGVLVKTISTDNSGNILIPVRDLADGFYLLKAVKKDRSVLTGKFVK